MTQMKEYAKSMIIIDVDSLVGVSYNESISNFYSQSYNVSD